MKTDQTTEAPNLSQQAEEKLQTRTAPNDAPNSEAETTRLLHELQGHHIELKMQNGELQAARAETEAAAARYADLYDYAPAGYFTLNSQGAILQTNLAGAALLESELDKLQGTCFGDFVAKDNLPAFNTFLDHVFSKHPNQSGEVTLKIKDGQDVIVQIDALLSNDSQECRVTAIDITKRKQAENELKKSERQFSTLVSNLPGIAYRCKNDSTWTMEFISQGCKNLTGYATEDLVGNTSVSYSNLIHPDDLQNTWNSVQKALKQKTSYEMEYRIITSQKQEKWVWEKGSGQFSEQNELISLEGFISDITERKQAEKDLQESEERFKALHNATFGGVAIHDKGIILVCNQGLSAITGYSVEELEGMDGLLLVAKQARKVVTDNIASGHETPYEVIGVRKDGEEYPLRIEARNIPYKGQDVRVAEFRDITERKNAEKNANEERERLAVTLRSIGDGVITTDVDGRIVLLNKVSEQLTGWMQDEAINHPIQEVFNIVNEETGLPRDNPVEKALASGQIIELANHTTLIDKNGTRYRIEDSGAPILNKDSEIIGAVLVFRDVTEKRRNQEELIKIRKLESVGVLAGGIAHDFNNLLVAILGNIELAEEYADPTSNIYELLSEAKKASIRATGLTQQLLTFSKGGDPVKKTASISQVITDSANFILHGSSTICEYSIPEDLWKVEIDAGQISQVIQNIVINARDAMPDGGAIEVRCENVSDASKSTILLPGQNYIKIIIKDFGSGISSKDLDKIFDPYFSTKRIGSGLGLSICHSIIIKHNGNIFVESEENKGTTFTIYLPASTEATQDIASIQPQIVKAKNRATIMIMDDEAMMRDISRLMITSFGHEVLLAENGHEAIEIYKEYHKTNRIVDIIIMDITIPGGMGGKDAVQQILKINPEAKVIVASGYANDPLMANYKEYGFKASIAKPFRMSELNKLINQVLSEK